MFSSSAPGSLMLFGEHAVLHGKQALCCAVDQRIHVTLRPRQDRQIHISSRRLGKCVLDLETFAIQPPFEFVLTAIDQLRAYIRQGFELDIHADFCSSMGLGSSSAVTVAAMGTLARWLELDWSLQDLFQESKQVILRVQGVGSGADVAAAVFGGIVAYRTQPLAVQVFPLAPAVTLVYSGAKVPTRTVIQIVAEKQQADPARYQQLYDQIDACASQAVSVLSEQNWLELGRLMNQHQSLQAALGVSTPLLDELVAQLNQQPGITGAKISGSGLGDCVVALGSAAENYFPANAGQEQSGVQQIPVTISTSGYRIE